MIPLGAVAKDTITGFEGVVVARTEWLHGCVRLAIQPKELHEGQPVKQQTFDEPQLEEVEPAPTDLVTETAEKPAGPRPDAVRHPDPAR